MALHCVSTPFLEIRNPCTDSSVVLVATLPGGTLLRALLRQLLDIVENDLATPANGRDDVTLNQE